MPRGMPHLTKPSRWGGGARFGTLLPTPAHQAQPHVCLTGCSRRPAPGAWRSAHGARRSALGARRSALGARMMGGELVRWVWHGCAATMIRPATPTHPPPRPQVSGPGLAGKGWWGWGAREMAGRTEHIPHPNPTTPPDQWPGPCRKRGRGGSGGFSTHSQRDLVRGVPWPLPRGLPRLTRPPLVRFAHTGVLRGALATPR